MENLSLAKILKYDSMLEELTLMSFTNFTLSDDQLYYYQSGSKRLGQLKHTYLKLEPISWHYYSHENEKWKIETLYNQPKNIPNALIFIRFKIIGVYYSLDKLLSKSKLKGFSRVLDDNNYFSRTPIINELVHWDNGVLITPNTQITIKNLSDKTVEKVIHYPNKIETISFLEDWATYNLLVTNDRKGAERLVMTGERGHTHS